jgi:DNA-binding beta-propeller fold protein YncE
MAGHPLAPYALVGSVVVAVFSISLLTLTVPAVEMTYSPVVTSTDWELGSGLATVSGVQNVTGTSSWISYCPSPLSACMVPVGLAYIPAENVMVLTEMRAIPVGSGGTNAVVEFDPSTLAVSPPLSLNCSPEVPFYPGHGADVFVPCLDTQSYSSGTLLVIDSETESIVANFSMPFREASMAFDPSNGVIYVAGYPNALAAIDPANDTILSLRNLTDVTFSGAPYLLHYMLAYDPLTGDLIAPATSGGLAAIDPTTGVVRAAVPLPSVPFTIAMDPATAQVFVGTYSPSFVEVLDGTTYDPEARIAIPNCIDYICGGTGAVDQILFDTDHGDAYVLTTLALVTVNLSALSPVSTVLDYGDGPLSSAAYAPATDRVFGTYGWDDGIGPGVLVQLNHSTYPAVTELFWLPTSTGALVIAVAAGVALAVLRPRVRRRPPATGAVTSLDR